MKLTAQRLKKLIREELEKMNEEYSFKKTGIEKFMNPETGKVIVVNHDEEFIEEIYAKTGKPTGIRFVYDQDFSGTPGFQRMGQDKFNKTPKNLGVS